MKKTLMVLSFALCASFAFAQTRTAMTSRVDVNNAVSKVANDAKPSASYTGSIFTKATTFFTETFAANSAYTTGVAGANMIVDGAAIPQHQQTSPHAQWARLADTSLASCSAFANTGNYPVTFDPTDPTYYIDGFASPSAEDGLMVMTMQDQIAAWGGSGTSGAFDAYISFTPFATTGANAVYANLYQFYKCFNNDKCYIDYSTNGSTWSAVEFNVRGVDVNTNKWLTGDTRVPLPASLANQASVYLRLRWVCDNNAGGAYGYLWFVDDFKVKENVANEILVKGNYYFDGLYGLMPQNLNVPIVWAADAINFGTSGQDNVTGAVYSWMGNEPAMMRASNNIGHVDSDPMTTFPVAIDPLGWYDITADGSHGWELNPTSGCGTYGTLPTSGIGVGHYYANIFSDNITYILNNDSNTFDTLPYTVNYDPTYGASTNPQGMGVWGRDNGTLRKFSYFANGLSNGEYLSIDPDETGWDQQGYIVTVSYYSADNIPEGWKILGVEMVTATREGFNGDPANGKSRIYPLLVRDSTYVDGGDNYVSFRTVATGAGMHTIDSSEFIHGQAFEDLTYKTYGQYPTIFIPFPNQPELKPNTHYRVGYELAEDCQFAVATNGNYYFSLEDSTSVYFNETEGMKAYSHIVRPSNNHATSVWVYDPTGGSLWGSNADQYPMIRMVVGPGFYVPKKGISFVCNEEEGYFADSQVNSLCGTVDSIPVGGSGTWYILPVDGYEIDKVYIDGVETEDYTLYEDGDEVYGAITLENVQADHTLSATFKVRGVGIDHVAGVSMKLQPNPATSTVNISMKGVNGSVNMALIDMSGRVITTSQFNAENGMTLNVSNLAKGAYFVRITNDKFSKVEKLIVR